MSVAEPGRRGWPTEPGSTVPRLARCTWVEDGTRYSVWYDPDAGLPPGWAEYLAEHRAELVEPVDR